MKKLKKKRKERMMDVFQQGFMKEELILKGLERGKVVLEME
jgi:hypothetical protein